MLQVLGITRYKKSWCWCLYSIHILCQHATFIKPTSHPGNNSISYFTKEKDIFENPCFSFLIRGLWILDPGSQKMRFWSWIMNHRSWILDHESLVLNPKSSILYPVSCILYPVSCILYPVSCILYPVSYTWHIYCPASSLDIELIWRLNVVFISPETDTRGLWVINWGIEHYIKNIKV